MIWNYTENMKKLAMLKKWSPPTKKKKKRKKQGEIISNKGANQINISKKKEPIKHNCERERRGN